MGNFFRDILKRIVHTPPEAFHDFHCLTTNLHTLLMEKIESPFFVVLISGYTALGKTFLTHTLASVFEKSAVLSTDSFMLNRIERGLRNNMSGDDAEAINFAALQQTVLQLASYHAVQIPIYNHRTGRHDTTETIQPPNILFLEGSSVLYPQLQIPFPHINFFLDAEPSTRLQLFHDISISERGYSETQFLKEIPTQIACDQKLIEPSKDKADFIITVRKGKRYESTVITRCCCGQ